MGKPKRRQKSGGKLWIILILLIIVAGGVVAGVLYLRNRGGDGSEDSRAREFAKGPDPVAGKVGIDLSRRDIAAERIQYAMTRTQVEKVYGTPKPATSSLIDKLYGPDARPPSLPESLGEMMMRTGRELGHDPVYYSDGKNYLLVQYKTDKFGTVRVLGTRWIGEEKGKIARHTGATSYRADPLEERGKEVDRVWAIIDDPRWVSGPELRKLILGRWERDDPLHRADQTMIFDADSTLRFPTGKEFIRSAYRFIDDEHIETKLPGSGSEHALYVLCNTTEMYLVTWYNTLPALRGPYRRVKG